MVKKLLILFLGITLINIYAQNTELLNCGTDEIMRNHYAKFPHEKAQDDAFNVIEQRYNVGLVNSLDYNISRTNRNNAEIESIRAKYDLLFRSKVIDYYLGKQITF